MGTPLREVIGVNGPAQATGLESRRPETFAGSRAALIELGREADKQNSVAKALTLLSSFTAERRLMGVSELARSAGLTKSTAFRLLATLSAWELVERRGTKYALGPWLAELAALASDSHRQQIRDVALPFLQDLYEMTHETVHLAVPDGAEILYIEKIYGHNRVDAPSRVGGRMNAGCTALGKSMLAFSGVATVQRAMRQIRPITPHTIVVPRVLAGELQSVRSTGVAFDREESALGIACVAAPIMDRAGIVLGAVSVCGAANRFDPTRRAVAVQHAATSIAKVMRRQASFVVTRD